MEVSVGAVAHGGFCVARHEGRAVFVRHAIPGERVVAEVTEGGSGDRFLRADAVEVLEASPDRVVPPCRYAGPGGCGGCDWQHVSLARQRALKADVVAEQLSRLAGIEVSREVLEVEAVRGDVEGLRWRTRVDLAVDRDGSVGLRAHRSRRVVPVSDCLQASEPIAHGGALGSRRPGCEALVVTDPSTGTTPVEVAVRPRRRPALVPVVEQVDVDGRSYTFSVAAQGFWQAHRGAPSTLAQAVLELADVRPGMSVLDLYCGVGLFTAPLADRVGAGGSVIGVEGDPGAVAAARENLAPWPHAQVRGADVGRALRDLPERPDVVVLDPPRSGAGRVVVEQILALRPGAIVYVACDPAALARDVAIFEQTGYELADLRAFDTFPMTQHVECVALLLPVDA